MRRARWPEEVELWYRRPDLARIAGGETLHDVLARAARGLRALVDRHPEETVVLVGHDCINRMILLYALVHRPPRRAVLSALAPAVVSAVAIAAYHWALYGFFDPRRVYGRRPELSLAWWPIGLPGLLFDQEFGLLVYAPVFALAAAGVIALWRMDRRLAITSVLLVMAVMAVAGAWPMWRGGPACPPAPYRAPSATCPAWARTRAS